MMTFQTHYTSDELFTETVLGMAPAATKLDIFTSVVPPKSRQYVRSPNSYSTPALVR